MDEWKGFITSAPAYLLDLDMDLDLDLMCSHLPDLHWPGHQSVEVQQYIEMCHLRSSSTLILDVHLGGRMPLW